MTVLKPAAAQLQNNNESAEASVPERQSVLQRARPDYDAPESRLEGFILRSTLETAETWSRLKSVVPAEGRPRRRGARA